MTYSPVDPDAAARLGDLLFGSGGAGSGGDIRPPRDVLATPKRWGKRAVSRAIRWYVDDAIRRSGDEISARVATRLLEIDKLSAEVARVATNVELMKTDVAHAYAATVNLELLKGEFRSLLATIEDLGRALAPGAGLEGAAERVAELRERVNGLERRLRHESARGGSTPIATPRDDAPRVRDDDPPRSVLFDYVGFERRFRGAPDRVTAVLDDRYGDLLTDHSPVLDVGCGRGELLGILGRRGIEALGVDTDPSMVAEARGRGLDAHEADALSFIASRPPASLGAIIAIHVVEHLELDYLVELLELAASRLRPGGLFIAETPNPMSLIVLGNSYILDPTHVRPLHPSLLTFLFEGAGYRSVDLRLFEPATDYHLPLLDSPDLPDWAARVDEGFARLNEVLFGPQEYAALARTPD